MFVTLYRVMQGFTPENAGEKHDQCKEYNSCCKKSVMCAATNAALDGSFPETKQAASQYPHPHTV